MRTNSARLWPIYRSLVGTRELSARLAAAEAALADCHLCGNDCGIDRTRQAGPCGLADTLYVASYGPHHGEEDVLRGRRGSGTIFFSGCNLHCVACQNYDISQQVTGFAVDAPGLAKVMLALQAQGCHNVNLVSPTHIASLLVPALVLAAEAGLAIPIVYNSGGYDAPQALALMDGLVDIYLPDMKYAEAAIGEALSAVRDYPAVNRAAVREMHRQVGELVCDDHGVARRGLLVRHLVLPGGLAGTAEVAGFLADEISPDTYINVMAQYRPAHRAYECATPAMPLDRRVTPAEVAAAMRQAHTAGLWRFDER
ncbi:MAG: radical SAM protein [Anaerolineae bacterium]|nr:radical SAM protein [Anaerolineae bacterium]